MTPIMILHRIEHALHMGYSPATVLDENSPIRDEIRKALADQDDMPPLPPDAAAVGAGLDPESIEQGEPS
jgi:hypothetical protein